MKPFKPLLFLTFRTTVNGLRRAVTTPKRLAYFIFFVFYYFMFFIRPALVYSARDTSMPTLFEGRINFPPLDVVDSLAFGLFSIAWVFILTAMTNYQGTLRPADVDVLFPTPISPKLILAFRMVRDYFFTLVAPLFLLVIGLYPTKMGWQMIFSNMPHPEYSGLAVRALMISWILMSFCAVAAVHAVGLFVNRSDKKSDKYKSILSWVAGIYIFGIAGFIASYLYLHPGVDNLIAIAQMPTLRALLFMPSLAAELTMAPFKGSLLLGLLSAAAMIGIGLLCFRVAFNQIAWFYDQAAIRGYSQGKTRQLMRSGDMMAIMAERARTGKFKVKRLRWFYGLRMPGGRALIWKELLLIPRTMMAPMIVFALIEVFASILPALSQTEPAQGAAKFVLFASQGAATFALAMAVAQTGFIEVLKRVDLQKALPFPATAVVANEVLAKAIVPAMASWIGVIAFTIVAPGQWPVGLAAAISTPAFGLLLVATGFFVNILFPDVEDQTQRQFRGLMMMLGSVIAAFFPVAALLLLVGFSFNPLLAAMASAILSIGLTAVAIFLSGSIYVNFNPSE